MSNSRQILQLVDVIRLFLQVGEISQGLSERKTHFDRHQAGSSKCSFKVDGLLPGSNLEIRPNLLVRTPLGFSVCLSSQYTLVSVYKKE